MFLSTMDFKNEEQLKEKILKTIDLYQKQLHVAQEVLTTLKKYEGKKITARIKTELSNNPRLEPYTIYYSKQYYMYELVVWGSGIDYGERMLMVLGYVNQNDTVNIEKVTEHFQCYLLNQERIQKLKQGLNILSSLCSRWNDEIRKLKEINHEAEHYELQYEFDLINQK